MLIVTEQAARLNYEVGIAIIPAGIESAGVPGYSEATSGTVEYLQRGKSALIVKGHEALKSATEALASQIGATAHEIAEAIDKQTIGGPTPGQFGVESVEVSFGVTLCGGMQALFTAQAESSAQVKVTLTRQP